MPETYNKKTLEEYKKLVQEVREKVEKLLEYDNNCVKDGDDSTIEARLVFDQCTPNRLPLLEELVEDLDRTVSMIDTYL